MTIEIVTLVCSIIAVLVSSWCAWMVWRLADRVVSKLDTHILEVVEEPMPGPRDGDRFSLPARPMPPSIVPTHAERAERTLRRGVPGWPGHVHGA